jgi:MFS family permease
MSRRYLPDRAAFRARVALLGRPQFRNLLIGRSVSFLGDAFSPVALPFAVLAAGGTATDIGLVLGVSTVVNVVLLLAGGVVADRLPRRVVLLGSDLLQGAAMLAIAVLLFSHDARIWNLLVAQAFYGAGQAVNMPATTALIPEVVEAKDLQSANALLSGVQSTAGLIGPGLAGILVATGGAGWAFAIDAASFVVSATFLAFLRVPPRTPAPPATFFADLAAGWRELTARRWYRVSLIAHGCWNFGIAFFFVLGPVIAAKHLGGARSWGLIGVALAAGSLVGSAVLLGRRIGRPLLVGNLVVTVAAFQMLTLLGPSPLVLIMLASAAWSGAVTTLNGAWNTTVAHLIPSQILARLTSYDWLISLAIMPAGYAVAGPIAAAAGTRTALLIALAAVTIPCFLTVLEPGVRKTRAPDSRSEAEVSPNAPDQPLINLLTSHLQTRAHPPGWSQDVSAASPSGARQGHRRGDHSKMILGYMLCY